MKDRIILSLFDYTGHWCEPYRKAGYTVIQRDLKFGDDIFRDTELFLYDSVEGARVHGIMAAVPCTDFARSGAHLWKEKDGKPGPEHPFVTFENRLDYFVSMVLCTLFIVERLEPAWWVIENPVGRLPKLVPELGPCKLYFQPWEFGDPYSKKTGLWGDFNPNLQKAPVLNLFGSEIWKMSSKNQDRRSTTPKGFANAFFRANP